MSLLCLKTGRWQRWLHCAYYLHLCMMLVFTWRNLWKITHMQFTCNNYSFFHSEAINVPMIPLGLKETKEVDFAVSIQVKKTSHISPPFIYFNYQVSFSLRKKNPFPSKTLHVVFRKYRGGTSLCLLIKLCFRFDVSKWKQPTSRWLLCLLWPILNWKSLSLCDKCAIHHKCVRYRWLVSKLDFTTCEDFKLCEGATIKTLPVTSSEAFLINVTSLSFYMFI